MYGQKVTRSLLEKAALNFIKENKILIFGQISGFIAKLFQIRLNKCIERW